MSHRFVSWLRVGLGAVPGRTVVGDHAELRLRVSVDGVAGPTRAVTLHGPGDCAGLAGDAILRREPPPNAVGVSPTGFAALEFVAADLPWRLTPTEPATGQLTPWLALAVVPATARFARADPRTLPVLTVDAVELPPIASIATWAHVQLDDDEVGAPLAEVLRANPERARSRLLAARRLTPRTRYRACLVPTFEAGRRAGLGQPIGDAGVAPAWTDGAVAVELPVYDTWEFETGEVADFETLARGVRPVAAARWATPRLLDTSAVGGVTPATRYGFLRPPGATDALPDAAAIGVALEAAMTGPGAATPRVGPPRYGAITTGHEPVGDEPPVTAPRPSWCDQLNRDPRLRLFAAAGAELVRREQDALVDEVQRQLGDATRADELRRGAALAEVLAERLHERHVRSRPPAQAIAAFARGVGASRPLVDVTAPAWRRLRRPLGPLARGRATAGPAIARIGADLDPEPPVPRVVGLTTVRSAELAIRQVAPPPRPPRPRPPRPPPGDESGWPPSDEPPVAEPSPLSDARVAELRLALAARAARPPALYARPTVAVLDVAAAAAPLFARDPAAPIRALAEAQIVTASPSPGRPAPTPAVTSSLAVVEALAALDRARFAPGADAMPPSTVSVLELDRAAVAAAVVGANHELARELAWRRLPFDPRATAIRGLWRRGDGAAPPITSWTGPLGASLPATATVFVLRSELVRRFPDAIYALAPAVPDRERHRVPGPTLRLPVFRFDLGADLVCVGFADELASLGRDLGTYLVILEAVGAARFGLDAAASDGPPAWVNLSWDAVSADPYLRLAPPPSGTWPSKPRWAGGAAAMAAITERPAVRLALHLDELVP